MSDYGDLCRDLRTAKAEARAKHGVPCPECVVKLPKACPSILLPQQRCRIHGYRDPRPRTADTEYMTPVNRAQEQFSKVEAIAAELQAFSPSTPEKELPIMNAKTTIIEVTTKTLVNGVDIKEYSDAQVYQLIADQEAEIACLEAIKSKPKKLVAEIEKRQEGIAALVAHLDSKE